MRPLLKIPVSWVTEITHVIRNEMFVDEQRKGPFGMWHHEHHFRETDDGVEMTDLIHYRLPMDILDFVNKFVVGKKLEKIFSYRSKKIKEIFNG